MAQNVKNEMPMGSTTLTRMAVGAMPNGSNAARSESTKKP